MAAGSLVIELLAKTGSFTTDIQRATKDAEKRLKEFEATAVSWGKNIGTAAVAAGAAFVYFAKEINDGIDALNDVADATGASIENISGLEDVALRTGASLDDVSSILIKFNNILKEADGKNGVSQALAAIGVNAEELKKLDPAEALLQTAQALNKFEDDGNKARIMAELFGKSVGAAAAYIKDLGEQAKLNPIVSKEQAEQAEAFNKSIFELTTNVTQLARELTGPLVESLNEVIKLFKEGRAAGKSFLDIGLDNYFDNVRKFYGMKPRGGTGGGATGSWDAPEGTKPSLPDIGGNKEAEEADKKADEERKKREKEQQAAAKRQQDSVNSYLDGLKRQLEATQELTTVEKVLLDIQERRITGVSRKQQEELLAIAERIDKEKELDRVARDFSKSQKALNDDFRRYQAALEDLQSPLETYLQGLERVRQEYELGIIDTQDKYTEATKRLGDAYVQSGKKVEDTADQFSEFAKRAQQNIQDALGNTLEDALSGNFDNIGKMWLRLVQQMAAQALAAQLNEKLFGGKSGGGTGGGTSGGSFDWGSAISAVASAFGYKFASGLDYVPTDNFPALLHKGEAVVTAADNPYTGGNMNKGQQVTINSTLNVQSGVSRPEFQKALDAQEADILARIQRSQRQQYAR